MRIWIGRILLLLGAFALAAAAVATFWGKGAAARTPLNVNTETVLTGTATGLLAKSDTPVPVKYVNTTRADPKASTGDVIVLVEQECIVVQTDNPPDCPGKDANGVTDPRVVDEPALSVFAVDRRTALAVKDQAAYIKKPAAAYAGIIDKFPFGAQKKDYPYWDGTLGKTVTAAYQGTKTIGGVTTYRYDVTIPTTPGVVIAKATTPGGQDTIGSYAATQSIWVDPVTGAFVDQTGTQTIKTPDGTNVLDIDVKYTQGTVDQNVSTVKHNRLILSLIRRWVPIGGLVLGVILLGVGGWLVATARRARRGGGDPSAATTPLADAA